MRVTGVLGCPGASVGGGDWQPCRTPLLTDYRRRCPGVGGHFLDVPAAVAITAIIGRCPESGIGATWRNFRKGGAAGTWSDQAEHSKADGEQEAAIKPTDHRMVPSSARTAGKVGLRGKGVHACRQPGFELGEVGPELGKVRLRRQCFPVCCCGADRARRWLRLGGARCRPASSGRSVPTALVRPWTAFGPRRRRVH